MAVFHTHQTISMVKRQKRLLMIVLSMMRNCQVLLSTILPSHQRSQRRRMRIQSTDLPLEEPSEVKENKNASTHSSADNEVNTNVPVTQDIPRRNCLILHHHLIVVKVQRKLMV
eukprot:11914363-Ditylum_brightwellii.AAC.1